MIIMDGNNSQKRSMFANADPRRFDSDYFLPEEHVNLFQRKIAVKVSHRKTRAMDLDSGIDDSDDDVSK